MGRAIALLTDFGTDDIYVGVMKGVMHAICPDATFIDITHAIQPQNIKQAAFALLNSYKYFAPGTVFLVVVDPGVGSQRKPIAVEADGYHFVGPDNGTLSYALWDIADEGSRFVELNVALGHLISSTFHGRDIFAPAAARLASGAALDDLGETIAEIDQLPMPHLAIKDGYIDGEVLHIDHFGNIITSIGILSADRLKRLTLKGYLGQQFREILFPDDIRVEVKNRSVVLMHRTYSEAARGTLLALIDSSGFLEIAVNQGSAAALLNVKVGDPVSVRIGNT